MLYIFPDSIPIGLDGDSRSIACSLESEIKKYIKKKKEAVISNPDEFIKDIENNTEIKIVKIF